MDRNGWLGTWSGKETLLTRSNHGLDTAGMKTITGMVGHLPGPRMAMMYVLGKRIALAEHGIEL